MRTDRRLPAGLDQQGRYATRERERGPRHEHWAAAEFADTMIVPKHSYAESKIVEPRGSSTWTIGNLAMAAAIVAVIAWAVSKGPWL